jgi:fibronectin type 3 domain-containing protein
MKKIVLLFGGFILLLSSCSPEDPIPVEPGVATLLSPANDETCLDGTSLNDTQSNVDFSWSTATDAVSYEVVVTNLLTQSSQTFTAVSNQTTLALTKAEPYSWRVRSIGEEGSTPSESEQWKFYLAGDAVVNYAPFPSELISPRSGANSTPNINNLITLSWNASDVDGDLAQFEVYLDQTDATTRIETIDYQAQETSLDVEVENNATYYWKIIAIDANGNQSNSGVYSFRTN